MPAVIWQSELKAEIDRFAREKKELCEQIQEVESQLEWLRSERDDEITKLSAEKKVLQERLHDAESQISQLKSRKRDELKVLYFLLDLLLSKNNFFFSRRNRFLLLFILENFLRYVWYISA